MTKATDRVRLAARQLGLDIEIVQFDTSTRTASDAASAIGCHVSQIVKSLCFTVDGQPVMALVSGPNRLDEAKLARACDTVISQIKRADADTVKYTTGFSIGGVPPFGHESSMPVYIDQDLMQFDIVWAAAGDPHSVFAIEPEQLRAAIKGQSIDLKSK